MCIGKHIDNILNSFKVVCSGWWTIKIVAFVIVFNEEAVGLSNILRFSFIEH